jgi:hypothetical protein
MPKADKRLQPAPELVSAMQLACSLLEKYIAICDAEIDALMQDSSQKGPAKARQLQILMRTMQGLQKDWLKTKSTLHPNIPVPSQPEKSALNPKDLEAMSDDDLRSLITYLTRDQIDQDEEAYQNFLDEIRSSRNQTPLPENPPSQLEKNIPLQSNRFVDPSLQGSSPMHQPFPHISASVDKTLSEPNSTAGAKLRVKNKFSHTFFRRPPPQPDF